MFIIILFIKNIVKLAVQNVSIHLQVMCSKDKFIFQIALKRISKF